MSETQVTIEGKFKTDEKNFIVLIRSMLEATLIELKCLEDRMNGGFLEGVIDCLREPLPEKSKIELGMRLNQFLLDNVLITDDILKLGYQYDSILQMLKSYSDYLMSDKTPPTDPS